MKKKIYIQFFLISLILLIIFVIYQKYFKESFKAKNIQKKDEIIIEENNVINNITYESIDNKGRRYIIKSEAGTFDEKKPQLISMSNVNAKVTLLDKSIIYINSKEAEYNNITYDTKFYGDVDLEYLEHSMLCNNLNIFFKENLLEAFNDLTYKNSDIIMFADKIEMDLLTKNSKIFKFDENKVKIETRNSNGNN